MSGSGGDPACARSRERGFAELAAAGEERLTRGAREEGALCLYAALRPAVDAKERRANAFFLLGESADAIAEHEALLARDPSHHDSWLHLGTILSETAAGDVARLRRARAAFERFLQEAPESPRSPWVKERIADLDRRIDGGAPPVAPGATVPSHAGRSPSTEADRARGEASQRPGAP